jgi:hypothetical protein
MAFSDSVEQWRAIQDQFSGEVPTDYALDWMRSESGGNRCNVTTSAGFPEVGLFQLDPGNANMAGVTQDQLLVGCQNGRDVSGSADDRLLAVSSGVDYIKALKSRTHAQLQAVGVDWDEGTADFWAAVRVQFSAGLGAFDSWLTAATSSLGRGPANWDEFVSSSGAAGNHWIDVAAANGAYGAGFVSLPSFLSGYALTPTEIVLVGLAAIGGLVGAMYFGRWLFAAQPA